MGKLCRLSCDIALSKSRERSRKVHTEKILSEYDQEIPQSQEEPHNNHETPGRQTKQSNQLSLPRQDDCKTRRDIKKCTTKHRTITESHNGSNNKQQSTTTEPRP